jgi:cytoskeletal protein RodZ
MRSARSEHIVLAVLLLVPLAVAFIGWPMFVRWAAGPTPQPTPEVAGAEATSAAVAAASQPTPKPTVGAPQTVVPRAVATQAAQVVQPTATQAAAPIAAAAQPTATRAPQAQATVVPTLVQQPLPAPSADDPGAAVQDFYARVARHDFAGAAALWSPQMRAQFPPSENINTRFSQTRSVTVHRAQVVSEDPAGSRATVAVDLTESAADGQHHWSGDWQLVHGPNGWLLDQPALRPS